MTVVHGEHVVTWTEPDPLNLRATLVALPGRRETLGAYDNFGRHLAGYGVRVHVVTQPDVNPTRAVVEATELLAGADVTAPRALFGSDIGALFASQLAAQAHIVGISHLILAGIPRQGEGCADIPASLFAAKPVEGLPVLHLPGPGSPVTPAIAEFLTSTRPDAPTSAGTMARNDHARTSR